MKHKVATGSTNKSRFTQLWQRTTVQCVRRSQQYLVFVSADHSHDYHAVHHFVTVANQHLKSERTLKICHEVQYTDGCSVQYKSFGPFSDLSLAQEDFGFTITRCFFGSGHGKGPSDGESALIKQFASRAVKSGQARIGNAQEMSTYLKKEASKVTVKEHEGAAHSHTRTIFYVAAGTINRDRSHRKGKPIVGTRQIHSVRTATDDSDTVQVRNLSCWCPGCLHGSQCENSGHVDVWQTKRIRGNMNKTKTGYRTQFCV